MYRFQLILFWARAILILLLYMIPIRILSWSGHSGHMYLEFQSAKKILFYCKLTVNPNCILPNWFTHCSDICCISIRFYWKCLLVLIYILIQNYVKVDQHHPPTSIAKFSLCVYKYVLQTLKIAQASVYACKNH